MEDQTISADIREDKGSILKTRQNRANSKVKATANRCMEEQTIRADNRVDKGSRQMRDYAVKAADGHKKAIGLKAENNQLANSRKMKG